MRRTAALAHDTFNAGIDESWQFNSKELRNSYSLRFITDYLEDLGFKHRGQVYFQRGDPTPKRPYGIYEDLSARSKLEI